MRMVVTHGTSKKANIEGYEVIAKTGTAYQAKHGKGGYGTHKTRTNTFFGAFPHNNPKYAVIVMMDDPQPTKDTYGYATAGWNVTPIAGQIIERIAIQVSC
jgi:cell division protein FtsI (penicillin-binding protein 3)